MPRRSGEYLHVRDGELAHLDRNGRQHPSNYSPEQKREFHAMLVGIAIERGNKLGAAAPLRCLGPTELYQESAPPPRSSFRQPSCKRAYGCHDRSNEAVTGELSCAITIRHHTSQLRLLQRQENTHVTRRWVKGANKSD